jgi:hypothetical protein
MIERCEDLFAQLNEPGHLVGISTNGFIKRDGRGVMGRGCALTAAQMHPDLPLLLGQHLKAKGNVPGRLTTQSLSILGFQNTFLILPVKHNWYEKADVDLVIMSIRFLMEESKNHPQVTFHVPRLGCGNGRLSWLLQVAHLMEPLPNNVVVHH